MSRIILLVPILPTGTRDWLKTAPAPWLEAVFLSCRLSWRLLDIQDDKS
jgi:hypothetical protein